jgi:hypothetical protein
VRGFALPSVSSVSVDVVQLSTMQSSITKFPAHEKIYSRFEISTQIL